MHWAPRALAALALAAAPALASAEERILDFNSKISVQKSGALDVTETIKVNAENSSINHGIYRDFPTKYELRNGGKMKVGFDFIDATLDGGPVDSARESIGNGVRIKLGSADSYVTPGEHSYTVHYRVTRELGFFKDYDELYWNVTGNGWMFPIDRASATITLPSPASFGQRAVYTGPQGSTAANAEVTGEGPGTISFATTAPLGPYEGMTVAAAFPKGVVDEPSANQKLAWALLDWLPVVIAALGLAGIAFYLFYAWIKVGRDPPEGTIVPLFSPPDDLSPAAMRYVVKQGFDDRAFAAALVEAGVKGHAKLVEEKGFLFFGGDKYIERPANESATPLESPEASALERLVGPGERIELDNENHATFSAAKTLMESAFKRRFEGTMFLRNYDWAGTAVLVWAFAAYCTALAIALAEGMFMSPLVLLPPVLLVVGWLLWRSVGKAMSSVQGCLVKVVGFLLLFLGGGIGLAVIPMAIGSGRWAPLVLIALGLPIALTSFIWISAPTQAGRALLDKIAGFKQYLGTTERERFDRMQAPNETLQLFERYLPYAIALDVENRWADRFAAQIAAAQAAGSQAFGWYSGSHSPWTDTGGFVNSLGSSLSSSISSASTAPGSSSGSGGGGSSGGGGGGGGGGGW